jgi:peptide/nickel transport system permease protein
MIVYAVRRLLAAIPVMLAATMFTFLLVDVSGDPTAGLVARVPPVPEETILATQERLYEDRAMHERYWIWLTGWSLPNGYGAHHDDIGLLRGRWGPSNVAGIDIGQEVGDRLVVTLRLTLAAAVLSLVLAVIAGMLSAIRQYSKTDHILTFLGFLGLAMPIFWFAQLLKESAVWLNTNVFGATVFYVFSATSANYNQMTTFEKFGDIAAHLTLPTLALTLTGFASISRFQRASMLEVLNSDYVRLARAKGLRNRVVMRKHALRTALIPVVTLAALLMSGLLTGAVITETVFGWRGLGTFLTASIFAVDIFAVMSFLVIAGALVVVSNLVADLLYGVLDPRIRYE